MDIFFIAKHYLLSFFNHFFVLDLKELFLMFIVYCVRCLYFDVYAYLFIYFA